jgi:hypothetical protein
VLSIALELLLTAPLRLLLRDLAVRVHDEHFVLLIELEVVEEALEVEVR